MIILPKVEVSPCRTDEEAVTEGRITLAIQPITEINCARCSGLSSTECAEPGLLEALMDPLMVPPRLR